MDKIEHMTEEPEIVVPASPPLSTRHDLQLARRLFHLTNGSVIAGLYMVYFSYNQMVQLLGTIACLVYVVEQIRINYPSLAQRMMPLSRFIIRAEEQLKESAMIPYMMAILLAIITFPKHVAVTAIFVLAISDPLSAVIGIKFGKTKIFSRKSLEGSLAFFASAFIICHYVLVYTNGEYSWQTTMISLLLGLLASIFEVLPIKLDDNLTIPLTTGFILWPLCEIFNFGL